MNSLERLLMGVIAAIVLCAGVGIAAYSHGVGTTKAKFEAIIAKADKDHTEAIVALNGRIAIAEHKAGAVMAAIDQHHQEDIEHEKKNIAATLASYRAGTLRLRDEFKAHCAANTGMPSATPSAGVSDAASDGGLQPDHVEFLIHFASRAKQVVQQLDNCQAVVRADRAVRVQP